MGRREGIIVLAEFIGEHKLARVDIHFQSKKYLATNAYIEINTNTLLDNYVQEKEILHFIVDQNLINDISLYRADHCNYYPVIDIMITSNNRRAFVKDATLIEWQSENMAAIIDTVKFFTDNTYELATDKSIQNGFLKAKMKDPTFRRFYQIVIDEE